jgi:hypothetical protein
MESGRCTAGINDRPGLVGLGDSENVTAKLRGDAIKSDFLA